MNQRDNPHQNLEHDSKSDPMSIYKTFQTIIAQCPCFSGTQGTNAHENWPHTVRTSLNNSERTHFLHHNTI